MKSELIVDVQAQEVSIALLEDGRLVSLQKEARNISYAVGDIYLAKVKKLMPGLNAAFVNVGYEKDAFLHYLDLGPYFNSYREFLKQLLDGKKKQPTLPKMNLLPDIDKHGSVTDTLQPGQELLVQIVKEPISSKGPRLTTELSFTGRYLVLTPFCDKISISQKIKSSDEKFRLRRLIEAIKPANFGVIVRTSAEGKKSAELHNELKTLLQAFYDTCEKACTATAPSLVFEEENRVVGMLRDVFSPSFEAIYVNDQEIFAQILKYVSLIAPERRDIVKLYAKDAPIFDHYGITRQIKSSFGKTVSFKSGAYIIIEHTEALHVIDVNSGNRTKAGSDQESNALEVNLRAADEIARQLRLRDMGGIIVVDFIDMAKSEHRQQLFDHMREIMANDRARHNILPLSKFGLMQITRQRVRPVLDIHVSEQCPSCRGKGEVQPSILFTDTLFDKLQYIVETLGMRDFIMYVHPYVDAYIKKGIFSSMYGRWRRTLGRCFKVLPDESLAYLQYRVVDKDRNELNLIDEKDNGQTSASKNADKRKRGDDNDGAGTVQVQQKPEPKAKAEPKPKTQQPKPKAQPKNGEQAQQPKVKTPADDPKVKNQAEQPKPKAESKGNEQPKPKSEPKPKAKPQSAEAPAASNKSDASDSERQAPQPKPRRQPKAKVQQAEAEVAAEVPAVLDARLESEQQQVETVKTDAQPEVRSEAQAEAVTPAAEPARDDAKQDAEAITAEAAKPEVANEADATDSADGAAEADEDAPAEGASDDATAEGAAAKPRSRRRRRKPKTQLSQSE